MKKRQLLCLFSLIISCTIITGCSNLFAKKIDNNAINSYINSESEKDDGFSIISTEITETSIKNNDSFIPGIKFKIYFKLPSNIDLDDISSSAGISLIYTGNTKDILGCENSGIVSDFSLENSSDKKSIYSITVVNTGKSLSKENIDYIIKNSQKDIYIAFYYNGNIITKIPMEKCIKEK